MGQVDFERLLEDDDRKTVAVPSWGGSVILERLDGVDWFRFADLMQATESDEEGKIADRSQALEFAVALVSRSLVDESGSRPFDSEHGRRKLSRYPRVVIDLANELVVYNGFVEGEAIEEAKKK